MAVYISPIAHTAPEIISLTTAKLQLKVDFTEDDTLIANYVLAAIESCENYTNTLINESKFSIKTSDFVDGLNLNLSPIQSIDSVKYYDADNIEQTLDAALYELFPFDKFGYVINYKDVDALADVYDRVDAVTINVTTGYAVGTVPKAIQSAALLVLGDLYENRSDKQHKVPTRAEALLRRYRFYY